MIIFFKDSLPQILFGPFLNNLSHLIETTRATLFETSLMSLLLVLDECQI